MDFFYYILSDNSHHNYENTFNAKNDQTTAQKLLKITQKIQLFAQKHTEIDD